ncbi:uncharacterized protein [Leptinotarsa decemlineata]|uniref:uncharacterized protein n=1 Tax=Leptinotarsa decemlineata TaxID=7539 RepID=UPI003D304DC9
MEDILKKAEQARESLIPSKSEAVYQTEYKIYLDWLTRKNVMPKDVTETVFLAYFQELPETYSPNSLWTKWSMLKSMVTVHEKRDITKFNELQAFLKRKSKSYKPKKSAVLSPKDVIKNRSSSHTKEEIVSSGGSNFQGTFQNCTFIICNDVNK